MQENVLNINPDCFVVFREHEHQVNNTNHGECRRKDDFEWCKFAPLHSPNTKLLFGFSNQDDHLGHNYSPQDYNFNSHLVQKSHYNLKID